MTVAAAAETSPEDKDCAITLEEKSATVGTREKSVGDMEKGKVGLDTMYLWCRYRILYLSSDYIHNRVKSLSHARISTLCDRQKSARASKYLVCDTSREAQDFSLISTRKLVLLTLKI